MSGSSSFFVEEAGMESSGSKTNEPLATSSFHQFY